MSKQVILEIGHEQYLLPNDVGVATILKALAGARRLDCVYYSGRDNIRLDPDPVKVGMHYLPGKFKEIKTKPAPPLPKPNVAAPKPEPEPKSWEPPKDWRKIIEQQEAASGERKILPIPAPAPEPTVIHPRPMRAAASGSGRALPALPAPQQLLLE